jgi:secreted Zn-dependent insulinase-like peptidase
LNYNISHQTHLPSSAGLDVTFNKTDNGLEVLFHGYNEKLPELIDMVTKELRDIIEGLDDESFEILRDDMKKDFFNSLVDARELNTDFFTDALNLNHWTNYELYQSVEKVTMEEVIVFAYTFFAQFKTQVLVHGNITRAQTMDLVAMMRENLKPKPLDQECILKGRGYQLPQQSSVLRMGSLLKDDENSYTRIHYQAGPETILMKTMLRLLEGVLHTKAFASLRTKDQLGYDVGIKLEENSGILGLTLFLTSQEHKNSYSLVNKKMESFMTGLAQKIVEELSDEEFESLKQSRIKGLLGDDTGLYYEASRYWGEITEEDYLFNRHELAVQVTRALRKSELQDFFKSLTQRNVRKLTVQVIGNSQANDDDLQVKFLNEKLSSDEKVITNLDAFHTAMHVYPVVKI